MANACVSKSPSKQCVWKATQSIAVSFHCRNVCCSAMSPRRRNVAVIMSGTALRESYAKPAAFAFRVSSNRVLVWSERIDWTRSLCSALLFQHCFLVPATVLISDWILINLFLLTTAVKDKKMQGSLTLVVSLNIGENLILNLSGPHFQALFGGDFLLLSMSYFEKSHTSF